jgi:hypothetical protein
MRPRIEQELALLRRAYPDVEQVEVSGEDWFRLPRYPLPPGWRLDDASVAEIPIVFLIKADYPGSPPYGFLTPLGLNCNGTPPGNTGAAPKQPPFDGDWMHFSWSVETWTPTADVNKGSNLLAWCRSFGARFKEGA